VKLGTQWEQLADDWSEARIRVVLADAGRSGRAAQLLAPLQPVLAGEGTLTVRVVGHPDTVKRLLGRLDDERIRGSLEVVSSDPIVEPPPETPPATLRESWQAALATLPADWSDLLGELELDSSDYVEPAALHLAPINPRRVGTSLRMQFRSASRFGYGASPGMVRRCCERCEADNIRGRVEVLRVLSDTNPVGTQGPVWHIAGRMV